MPAKGSVGVMESLNDLLRQAFVADPSDRIDLRDPFAAHGASAIAAVEPLLEDSQLGGFSVRVLEAVAGIGEKNLAIVSLQNGLKRPIPEPVRRDIKAALERLNLRPAAPRGASFEIGASYTRPDIHARVGGSIQSYLPDLGGRVVAACLRTDTNPDAPSIILPGTGPNIERGARLLVHQRSTIPVFLKREVDDWEHVGQYRVVRTSTEPDDLARFARHARRSDITSVIWMARDDA